MDIITPLVDDPYLFGQVAAANALSDVYAMGGKPLTCMNLVFFPSCSLPPDVLAEMLAGGLSKMKEAGACLVGGHTVEDDELKYGLSVTGVIDPRKIVKNSTACAGDLLVLTKPLGTGIISTAIKAGMAPEMTITEASQWMYRLNACAASLMLQLNPSACTDVTGFGLIGHAIEMARGAGTTMRLRLNSVPLMHGVMDLVNDGLIPGGCYRNRDFYSQFLNLASGFGADQLLPLFDPQTSGGLLISMGMKAANDFILRAGDAGCFACVVGEVLPAREFPLEIV